MDKGDSMWPMLKGTRGLTEAEREVMVPAAISLFNQLCVHHGNMDRSSIMTGIPVFDDLTQERQMHALYQACDCLIGERSLPPERRFWLDAAVAAIFSRVLQQINEEIENGESHERRANLIKAVGWILREEGCPKVTVSESDSDDWMYAVSMLFDFVLPDEHYEEALQFYASDDYAKMEIANNMGVDMEYFDLAPRDSAYKKWDNAFRYFAELEESMLKVTV